MEQIQIFPSFPTRLYNIVQLMFQLVPVIPPIMWTLVKLNRFHGCGKFIKEHIWINMFYQNIRVPTLTMLIKFNYSIFRCIFFAYIIPEILTFLQSLKHVVFKTAHLPKLFDFFLVLLMESTHVTGMAILFYCALPHMDSVRAVMATRWT